MPNRTKEIVILRAYDPFLTYLTVYKLGNFRNFDRRNLFRNIWRAVGVTIIFATFTLFMSAEFVVAYRSNFALNETAQQLAFVIIGFPVPLIYFVMFWKSHKIIDTLNILRGVVVESRLISFNFPLFSLDSK